MKRECAYTRKSLRKYLRGHLFKFQQARIARHLNACPLCRSEFQALKRVADTKQLIRDITPPEGVVQNVKAGLFSLKKLKVLIYRPLWLIIIIAASVLIYVNLIAPNRRDVEIENLEKTIPQSAPLASAPTPSPVAAQAPAAPPVSVQQAATRATDTAPAAPVEVFMITITPRSEDSVRQINDIMRGHGQLRKLKFTETTREIPVSLTTKELQTFFSRIDQAASVSYSRRKFDALPTAQPVPFLMKMKPAPKHVEQQSQPASSPTGPAAAPAGAHPASAPTASGQ